jgi:hypothetical protein
VTRSTKLSSPWFAVLAALSLAGCQADVTPLAPLAWQKVAGTGPGGAISDLGAAGAFDERGTFTVSALVEGGSVSLYYGGADTSGTCAGINAAHWRIGLATSPDGLQFNRVAGTETGGAILDNGAPGSFDEYLTYRPFVLRDGALYRMWYNGSRSPFNCPAGTLALDRRVGYAESSDGLHWTKHYDGPGPGGSALALGPAGAIDAQQVGYVWVIKDGAAYRMYYSANDSNNNWRVALATSTDARTWTKVPGPLAGGAVLDMGAAGSFDVACAYQPSVVKVRSDLYRMWYRGCEGPGPFGGPSRGTIGYAESSDGIAWMKIPQPLTGGAALVQGPSAAFDSGGLTTPSVYADAGGWNMYYAGFDATGRYLIGLARAAQP